MQGALASKRLGIAAVPELEQVDHEESSKGSHTGVFIEQG